MTRNDHSAVTELMAQLAAQAAEIAALKVEKETLAQRIFKLEEELALARLHRFAPRSEKRVDRVFNACFSNSRTVVSLKSGHAFH